MAKKLKLIDYLLLLVVAVLLAVAVHYVRKGRSCCSANSGCSGNCTACSGKCSRKS